MKILHLINSLATGGAEKLLLDTLPLHNERSISVDLLLLNGSKTPFYSKLEVLGCCSIYSLGIGSVYNPLLIFKIIPYLKKYDIVHVHLFPAQYWVVLAKIFSFSKVKLVFTEHSTSNRRIQNPLFGFLDSLIYSYYTAIICITDQVKFVIQKHTSLPLTKFVIIENGVALEKINTAVPLLKNIFFEDSKSKLLIQVSSFHEPKDQKTVIQSLLYLPFEVKLLLVGEGSLQSTLKTLVKELNLQDRVTFLGQRMDVPNLLKTVDVIVLSSKYEGLSLSSIEGMASGKPFIASDVPGLSNVVGGAGLLFEQGNAEDLAQKIKRLLDDDDYSSKVAALCVHRAAQYDIKIMVDKHIALYGRLHQA